MKRAIALAVMLAAAPLAAAQPEGMKGMDMKMDKKDAKGTVHKATGVVTKVDSAKKKVTIKHEPVQSLSWPAMNMAFTVKDKAMLDKMPKDRKVEFEFVQSGKDYIVTDIK